MTGTLLSLETQEFEESLRFHIDESKPDPVLRRKIESLQLEWKNLPVDEIESPSELMHACKKCSDSIICGVLTLASEYISFRIKAFCRWDIIHNVDNSVTSKIDFELRVIGATCIMSPKSKPMRKSKTSDDYERSKSDEGEKTKNKESASKETGLSMKEKRIQRKLQSGMKQRYESDYYIKKLLAIKLVSPKNSNSKKKSKEDERVRANDSINEGLLCRAFIHQKSPESSSSGTKNTLEELFDVVEVTVKGLQRALFSFNNDETDAYLTTMEFLLSMPYLPRNRYNHKEMDQVECIKSIKELQSIMNNSDLLSSQKRTNNSIDCDIFSMADRVNHRLLEDAMFDACEMEGEDDLLDDLNISQPKQKLKV